MPKTQYFTATSLDGFIADADNSLDWLFQAEGAASATSGWSVAVILSVSSPITGC
jgi:dihydrofolate reductase